MQITRNSLETSPGPGDWFTGAVFIDTIATPSDASRLGAASVHFTPAARTAWHTHPFGQTIYVTEGIGRCQRRGGAIETLRPGDRVFFGPGEDHWHGAAPDRLMIHIAMQEADGLRQPGHLGRARQRRGVQRRAVRREHDHRAGGNMPHRLQPISGLQQIEMVALAKRAGFTLAEIRIILSGVSGKAPPSEIWRRLASDKLPEVERTLAEAEAMKRILEAGLRCECLSLEECLGSPRARSISSEDQPSW